MSALYLALMNSWRGLVHTARTERAVQLELTLLALAIPAACLVGAALWVRVALIASLLLVLGAELLNTAIEKLCDHLHPDRHEHIRIVKDVASAGAFATQALAALVWITALAERLA